MGPPLTPKVKKKDYTPSSDLNWGKSHISIANSSSVHKSAGSSKMSFEEDSRIVVALTEGRGEARCEVGIAAINVSKPLLILCQISDTQSYINTLTKINIFNPQEILVPLTFVESFSGNRLIDKVKEHFPRIKYTGCPRNTFNKASGMDILTNLCIPSLNPILLVLQHRYYALAAASALVTYVQDNLFVYYAPASIKIDYQESEGYAIIDVSTADRLELVCSTKPAQGNKYSSLFGVLNHCLTKIGSRTLRSSILQPPCRIAYIEERQNAVAELIRHPKMLLSIQALLQKVSNIDMLLSVGTLVTDDSQKCSNRHLNYILLLNILVDLIAPLKEVLSKSSHPFFVQLAGTLSSEEFAAIKSIVRNTIQENAYPAKGEAGMFQRCFAIKPGINGLLDLVRKTYSERLGDMREYVKKLAEKYDLALTLGNNQTKGHHMVLSLNQKQKRYMKKSDLPEEFIEVYRLAGSFTMKTPELVNLSTRLDDIMADILRISNVMVHSIIVDIRTYVTLFYKLCEEIAYLDLLQSLAECSVRNGYVRPKFGDFTEVTFARHPLLDFLLSTKPIPNYISCSSDYNLHIITGPNGSGKSIFIRQVVLLQVMAQVGCSVPAQTAIFRPADRMYARIYLEDNMEYGASTFILEMKELKYIMMTMTENSLVIIDEICRSTSLEEGTALAIAIVEKLAQSSAFIYVTTHFTLLTKLYDMYLNVKVWHLETIPSGEDPKTFKLDFKHNLIPGVTNVKRYGVYIVRNIWPNSILRYVDALLDKISKKPKDPKIVALDEKVRLKYKIESQFRKLKSQRKLTISEVNKLLNQYQNEMGKLDFHINVVPLRSNFTGNAVQQLPMIEHSVFGDIREDLRMSNAMRQQFTPEPSLSSQTSVLGTQRAVERMQAVFTPEPSQQIHYTNCMEQSCPNLNFYRTNDFNDGVYEGYQNHSNIDDVNYENMSRFIAENSENFHKLIPEIHLSCSETPKLPEENSNRSPSLGDMNDIRFSLPLQNNATKTSTPIVRRAPLLLRSASPLVHIYGNDRRNFSTSSNTNDSRKNLSTFIPEQIALEGYDLESIQDDLEACSRIFGEEDDGFEEEVLNTTYKSISTSCSETKEKIGQVPQKEKFPHIVPVVEVVEGPNNTTLSFGEDNFKDIPEDNGGVSQRKDPVAQRKINVISNILIAPREPVCLRKEEGDISKQENKLAEVYCNNNCFTNDGVNENPFREELVRVNPEKQQTVGNLYKTFDSTFDAAHSVEDTVRSQQLNETFMSFVEENEDILYSCESSFEIEPQPERSNCPSSGYEISAINDPSKFVTSPSDDKTATKEISVEKNQEKCFQVVNGQEKLSPNKTELTSISHASKLRKLDQSGSSDSSQHEESGDKKTFCDKTMTSLSSASKKRNLDQVTTDSTSANEKSDNKTKESDKSEDSSSLKESDEGGRSAAKAPKRKFSKPRNVEGQSTSTDGKIVKKRTVYKKKFKPPLKLSAREIREEFNEQDRRMLETSPNSSNFSKYLQQLINRPTVRQIQKSTHVATIRKTEDGVEVIPAKSPVKKRKASPWRNQFFNNNFNLTIFSDKNALPFESYLKSNEKDYNTFSFSFNKNQDEGGRFEFAPTVSNVGEYTSNSVTKRFARTASETTCSNQQLSGNVGEIQNITFQVSQRGESQTLTPDGFYKQNKDDIKRIVDKYLQGSAEEEKPGNTGGRRRSIFDTSDIDLDDLNI
ncbi:uncharacterized protein LOC108907240 [Anoplophora glabripennis]|uniref:uncharacterized protein LOC108907240 n=1 Tax=Anoplophora glabripennis TaxID=217634 RepID=UPI000873A6B0|nr:uncharacterized protein LOC108907240 [Anoplophora glabripennis]